MNNGFANIEPKPSAIRVAVAAVLRENPDGSPEVLAAWRSRASVRGGVWEFPGGKIEANESAAQAARRETHEELGVDIEIVRSIGVAEDYDPTQPREHHVTVELMLAHSINGDPSEPGRTWRWIPVRELDSYAWPRANTLLIAALRKAIEDQKDCVDTGHADTPG